MATRSLIVLAGLFACAFFGRAAGMAADLADGETAARPQDLERAACITGPLAEDLKAQRAAAATKDAALSAREEKLELLGEHLERRAAELERLNADVRAALAAAKSARDGDVRRVAAMYEGMKPQAAGSIIARMDAAFAASLLMAMNPETASAVLASLEADRAYAITVLMAEAL